ncbi:MAG: MBL fold metallo-hydrolase [Bacteroidota bacterium]
MDRESSQVGNIAASVGDDGLLLVDNMFARFMPMVFEKLKTLSDKPVRFAINTHYHGDHNSGNAALSSTATIIGHTKLYQRLASKTPALPPEAFRLSHSPTASSCILITKRSD